MFPMMLMEVPMKQAQKMTMKVSSEWNKFCRYVPLKKLKLYPTMPIFTIPEITPDFNVLDPQIVAILFFSIH